MTHAKKLQLSEPAKLRLINAPSGVLDKSVKKSTAKSAGILAFITKSDEFTKTAAPVIDTAREDGAAWIAYPKAKKLDTDLNRDTLAALFADTGVRPVRLVSLDDTWSAMRLRPGKM